MLEMVKMLRLRFRRLFLNAREKYRNKTWSPLLVAYRSASSRRLAATRTRKSRMHSLKADTNGRGMRFERIGE